MLKVGIIGFGYMGNFHYEKVSHFDDVQVTCAFDNNDEKLKSAEKKGLKAYKTLDEFLKEDIDLVVIATPNQWHEKYAVAAMKTGKNVLCEKPATMSVDEMNQIIRVSKETGNFFTVHQQRRFDPDYRVVKDIVNSGAIGKITTIESRVLGERGVCFGWRADPESGGGMLYDWGVHLIDQILQLYPEETVTSIYARVLSVLTPAVDDLFEITLNLSNGVCAKVNVGTFALQKLPRWFLFGDRGTLKLDDFSGTEGGAARIKGEVQGFESVVGQKVLGPSRTMAPLKPEYLEKIDLPKEEDMTLEYWRNLIEALRGKEALYVTTSQILRQMKIVEAAFESAKRNEVIKTSI
ncbi:MAG: Gfo/Idh/MocA family oxidoreductase [Lachnospiraceae bacterium]|nr:Gfo/Idh/MocA family oxidoreductase [Lachnospiraceae bacterium]